MFYLGGLTFGYLSPHAAASSAAVSAAAPARAAEQPSLLRYPGEREEPKSGLPSRPLVWPWHLFC